MRSKAKPAADPAKPCNGCGTLLRKGFACGTPKTLLLCVHCKKIDTEVEERWNAYRDGFCQAAVNDLYGAGKIAS